MNDLIYFFERDLRSNMKMYGQGSVGVARDLDLIQEKVMPVLYVKCAIHERISICLLISSFQLHCCGYYSYEDWNNMTLAVPQSCCRSSTCDTKNATDIFTTVRLFYNTLKE